MNDMNFMCEFTPLHPSETQNRRQNCLCEPGLRCQMLGHLQCFIVQYSGFTVHTNQNVIEAVFGIVPCQISKVVYELRWDSKVVRRCPKSSSVVHIWIPRVQILMDKITTLAIWIIFSLSSVDALDCFRLLKKISQSTRVFRKVTVHKINPVWQRETTCTLSINTKHCLCYFQSVSTTDDLIDVALAGHYSHGKDSKSTFMNHFVHKLPDWVHPTAWVSSYQKWTFWIMHRLYKFDAEIL